MKTKQLLYIGILLAILPFGKSFAQELDLDSCRNMALRHNKSIQISEQMLLSSQDIRKAAFTQFLPSFNAMGAYVHNSKDMSVLSEDALLPVGSVGSNGQFTYTLNDIRTIDYNGQRVPVNALGQPTNNPSEFVPNNVAYLPKESLTFDMHNIFAFGIGFSQPIFMGGKILAMYKMALSAENIAELNAKNSNINLLIQVDEAYWRVISLQKKTELAKQYNELLKTTYQNIKIMYEQGVVTKSDLLKVQVKLNESEMTLTKALNGLSLSKMCLNQICGMEIQKDYLLKEIAPESENHIILSADSTQKYISSRPEAQILKENILLAKEQVKIARSRFMPNIVAQGNYIMSNPNLFNGFDKSFSGMFSLGVAINMPIFHFGERVNTLALAKHNLKIAELTQEDNLEKMYLQASMKQNTFFEAQKQNNIATNNLLSARENLRQAELSFEQGVASITDLMEAQTSWVSAESEVIDSKINLALSSLYLNQSLGKIKVKNID